MEKILLLGVDSSTRNALSVCRSKGIYTIITDFLSPEQNPLKKISDEYWMINCTDIDSLELKCRKENITAVYAGNHELCLDCAQKLTTRLGLPFYASPLSWKVCRNKALFKKYCKENSLSVAKEYVINNGETMSQFKLRISYPVVVKPSDASSMKGFSIVRRAEDFPQAYNLALSFSESDQIIIEDYLEGMGFQFTGIAVDGKIQIFSAMNMHDYVFGNDRVMVVGMPFSVEKDPCFPPDYISRLINLAIAIEIRNGLFFFQGIRHHGKAYLIEVAARLDGGGMWNIYKMLTGYDMIELMIDFARGVKPVQDFRKIDFSLGKRCYAEYGPWIKPGKVKKVFGEEILRQDPQIDILLSRFSPGMEVLPSGNMTQMGWYINFIADSKQELFRKFETINNSLKIISEEDENLVQYFTAYDEIQI